MLLLLTLRPSRQPSLNPGPVAPAGKAPNAPLALPSTLSCLFKSISLTVEAPRSRRRYVLCSALSSELENPRKRSPREVGIRARAVGLAGGTARAAGARSPGLSLTNCNPRQMAGEPRRPLTLLEF